MIGHYGPLTSAVFITFPGNCKKALTFYQTCFGGQLQFESLNQDLKNYPEMPVLNGSLISDRIIIHGSDLVHDEGRKIGNYISIFLYYKNSLERKDLIERLRLHRKIHFADYTDDQKLIEVIDAFEVRWILAMPT